MDWFLYDNGHRHERVNNKKIINTAGGVLRIYQALNSTIVK